MRRILRFVGALAAALGVLALGQAAASRTLPPALRPPPPAPRTYRPAPLAPGDTLREAYRLRLNGSASDFARFASQRPLAAGLFPSCPGDPREGTEAVLAQGRTYWRSRAPLFPIGDSSSGVDPGGIRPPGARRLLSMASDRPDGLSAALYEGGSVRGLGSRLASEGWACLDLGEGLVLWARGSGNLLVDAPGPGRPGTSLLYWRSR